MKIPGQFSVKINTVVDTAEKFCRFRNKTIYHKYLGLIFLFKDIFSVLILLFSGLFLSGCTPPPPFNFAVPNVSISPSVINYTLKSTVVTLASPSEQDGPLPSDSSLVVPIWQSALEDAVDRSAVFEDPAPYSVNLECKILKIHLPLFGSTMETDVAARYQITDRKNGNVIFDLIIDTKGDVPFSYAFLGVVREKESVNLAIQNNISAFLKRVQKNNLATMRNSSEPTPSS
jgi:hypothetical protein